MTQPALRVIQPGLLTTIQDLGRPHAMVAGVQAGGAMDRFAHIAANFLVGNDRGAATLECTVVGPHLIAERTCVIAITGGDLQPRVNGEQAPMWTSIRLAEGDELSFGSRRVGARAYIAATGGFVGDRWLGSMSTNLMTARGGMRGRALKMGDLVPIGASLWDAETGRRLSPDLVPRYDDHSLHAIAGPHATPTAFDATFTVSPDSNRMGYRLDGASVDASADHLLSFALVTGAVQVPSGGRPILLMADHQTAGGYPVVAVVVSASMPVAAQLAPGDELRLVETTLEDALAMRAAQRSALDSLLTS
jgi:antagonist of KipI